MVYKILASFIEIPGIFFTTFLFLFIFKKKKIFLFLAITIYILSCEFVASSILKLFEVKENLGNFDVIVVPGGGKSGNLLSQASYSRILKAYMMWKESGKKIVVSGGKFGGEKTEAELMKDYLVEMGIPENEIIVEAESRNTIENAKNVSRILEKMGIESMLIVTSYTHMKRCYTAFRKFFDSQIYIVKSDYPLDPDKSIVFKFLPSISALTAFASMFHEALGMLLIFVDPFF